MENKVVYEVRLSKPVKRIAMVLALGIFANAAAYTFDYIKPAYASYYDIGDVISRLDLLQGDIGIMARQQVQTFELIREVCTR
jgi:hypothetical protein